MPHALALYGYSEQKSLKKLSITTLKQELDVQSRGGVVRRTLSMFIVGMLSTTVLALPAFSASPDAQPRKIVTGWLPYWNTKGGLASITGNPDLIPEVMPFWFSVKDYNKILDQFDPANSISMKEVVSQIKGMGISVIPTLTDGTGKLALQKILADAKKRATLVSTLATLAKQNDFDGLDLDFEGFAFSDGTSSWNTTMPLWTAFVKQLAVALHAQGDLLSVTTPEVRDPASGKKGYFVYNWPEIGPVIDRLRIMTYDYSLATPGPIGPISWVEQLVKYATTLMPSSKIWIGVPTYGRDWVVGLDGVCPSDVDLKAPSGSTPGTRAVVNSRDAATLASNYLATPSWNSTYGEYVFTYVKVYEGTDDAGNATSCTATRTVWYQDAKSVAARAALVAQYRLGGLTFWSLGPEDPQMWPSLRTYAKTIAPDIVLGALQLGQPVTDFAKPVSVTATFTVSDSRPLPNLPITFQIKRNSDTDWRDLTTIPTTIDGKAAINLIASQYMQVRVSSPSSWERLAAVSEVQNINVQRMIGSLSISSPRAGQKAVLQGIVIPREVSDLTLLEKIDDRWSVYQTGATLPDGSFSFDISTKRDGVRFFKVVARSDTKYEEVSSQTISLIVR